VALKGKNQPHPKLSSASKEAARAAFMPSSKMIDPNESSHETGKQRGNLNTETSPLQFSGQQHDWANIPTSERDSGTGWGGRAQGARLSAMISKRLILPAPSSRFLQGTVPALLLGKHLRAGTCIFNLDVS